MKKNLIILITIIFIFPILVNASTTTYERTKDNLRIPDKVHYKDRMYNNVISTPAVNTEEKIYDFADIFTDEEEIEIYSAIMNYKNSTNLDLAVVTTNHNNKESAMVYADDFYDYNDFDINGLLYLIDMDTREFYISTSGTALLYYNDYRIEYTLSSMDYSMINGNYKESIDILTTNLIDFYNEGIPSGNSKYEIVDGKVVYKTPYIVFIIISLIPAVIITIAYANRNKPVKLDKYSYDYLVKNGISITNRIDKYINTTTISHYSPISSDSGGSSGGGSSFHSGSSGISHGGGGHHF